MSNSKSKQAKPKTGLARCMELASDRKGLVFLAAVLSSLAAIASFIPYIAVYFMIRSIIGVFPNLDQLDMGMVMNYGWLALAGIVANILLYFLAIFSSHMAAFGTLYELKVLFADHITKIPLGYHLTIGSGRLRKIMDENIESVEGFIAHQFPDFVASITAPIVMVIILLAVDWRFGLASLVGIILAFVELLPLLMFLLMVTRIYGPILAILANLSSLLNLNVVTSRMRTLLTTPAMDGDGKTVPNCDIELSHVTFAYNQEDVIKDVSCKIPQGSVTALVGPSGSGKSTISKLIARFWDVQQGKITVGGKDIKSMEPESLMSYMSFVFQDVTLFNDTVMNNIRLGNPNATDDQVIAAAKAAYCDEFVREMPDGYQTVLGENGSTLSGGERQRISIARALLKNAPIILLDEATASLDPENEVLVQKAIAKLVEGKTVIMIAHRLRTVVDADQILVLDNGRLVEHGTHDELMKKNGLYHKLFHIQQESLGSASHIRSGLKLISHSHFFLPHQQFLLGRHENSGAAPRAPLSHSQSQDL